MRRMIQYSTLMVMAVLLLSIWVRTGTVVPKAGSNGQFRVHLVSCALYVVRDAFPSSRTVWIRLESHPVIWWRFRREETPQVSSTTIPLWPLVTSPLWTFGYYRLQRLNRQRHGKCVVCGYPRAVYAPRCSECGAQNREFVRQS